jgi:ABC-type sugar transport system ATPase subunit
MTLGDRIVIMRDGYIQQIGTPQEVFDHPVRVASAGMGKRSTTETVRAVARPDQSGFSGRLYCVWTD